MENLVGSGQVSDWISIATGGGFTVLAWYLIARVIPDNTKRFEVALERQRDDFTTEMQGARADFTQALAHVREEARSQAELQRTHSEKLLETLSTRFVDAITRLELRLEHEVRQNRDTE